mmetsp:Transcript_37374/g.6698  ORF Transcript_37374/g.6698 Transcript_37374/m.6698 type:complete len:98 (+) Transcript_37374:459-752(+)
MRAILQPGRHFGEIALVFKTHRTASVRSTNYCNLGELSRDYFEKFVKNFPITLRLLKHESIDYQDPLKVEIKDMIRTIPYFSNLPEEHIEDLYYNLE